MRLVLCSSGLADARLQVDLLVEKKGLRMRTGGPFGKGTGGRVESDFSLPRHRAT